MTDLSNRSFLQKTSNQDLLILSLSIALAAYTITRAALASITHDEVGGYLGYSIYSVKDILLFTNLQLGNHVLNSLLVKLSAWLFGVSDFTLRLPNLLAHLVFLYFSWKVIKMLTNDTILAITGFIMVNVNPYLLDFFSVSRGYGLQISLMAVSIYFLLKFWKDPRAKYIWGALTMSALGVTSVLTFIPVYFSTILLINFLFLVNNIRDGHSFKSGFISLLKANIPVIVISALLAALVVGPILRLEAIGEFSARANQEGFWDNLFRSVIRHSMYLWAINGPIQFIFLYIIQGLSAVMLIILGLTFFKQRWEATKTGFFILFSLLVIICLWFYLQHVFLGSRYPHQRTALFLFPLFLFTLIAGLDLIIKGKGIRLAVKMFTGLAAGLMIVHFLNVANFRSYIDWQHNADTKQMLSEHLGEMQSLSDTRTEMVNFGVYWMNMPTILYYFTIQDIHSINLVEYRDTFRDEADFYYVPFEFRDSLSKFEPVLLTNYLYSRTSFLKDSQLSE